ncbi:MAG: DUF4124 domain-containing protein [Burkholderiales bacterium]|nr:DUF4124 domain-containing protein [Burkholderiales bacterium]
MGITQRAFAAAFLCGGFIAPAQAQGIYTCIDSKGKRLTADRPIAECLDREQKELNPSGTVRRKVAPELTKEERAAEEEKARKANEERAKQAEERKRDQALATRYPNRASHDQERTAALAPVEEVSAATARRTQELASQRKLLDSEAEFYKRDMSKAPPKLKRQIEEADQMMATQKRLAADQAAERKRINTRFDEELAKLKPLWGPQAASAAAPAKPAKP